jgi:prepilin-type processing-associated H-X9-DG protein/prepilin-type N-terminal cleavage/methylation domain-containing protein
VSSCSSASGAGAFTLLEMLVVIGIIGILAGLLLPALTAARERGREAMCNSNLRQLFMATEMYCNHFDEYYLAAARDINTTNLERWHGIRQQTGTDPATGAPIYTPFDPSLSKLAPYLYVNTVVNTTGTTGNAGTTEAQIKQCPTFASKWLGAGAYEIGCGGYGMNHLYIGSHEYRTPIYYTSDVASAPSTFDDLITVESGSNRHEVRVPDQTVLFADAAAPDGNYSGKLIEYSFAEPNYFTNAGRWDPALPPYGDFHPDPNYPLDTVDLAHSDNPSLHFRHTGNANVIWCDGHVTSEGPLYSRTLPVTIFSTGMQASADYSTYWLGWFGADDNSAFRLEKNTVQCVQIPVPPAE